MTSCRFMVSGSLSLPSPGFFSPFPLGTFPLSVAQPYLALDRGRPSFRQGSSCPAVLRFRIKSPAMYFAYAALTLSGRPSHAFPLYIPALSGHPHAALQPHLHVVWAPPISLAATLGISGESLLFLISFPVLLRWFTSHSLAPHCLSFSAAGDGLTTAGLPHSAIRGSSHMCCSPRLFAAYHGLLRL